MESIDITSLRKSLGMRQIDFADKLAMAQSYLSEIERGVKPQTSDVRTRIINAFGDKVVGEFAKQKPAFRNEVTPVAEDKYMMVEYVDLRASAGKLGDGDVSVLPETRRRLVPREYEKGGFLVVRVDGDSMDDGTKRSLSDGDEVLIYDKKESNINDLPIRKTLFVITSREGNVLKQIKEVNMEGGYIVCHSFNPIYSDFRINISDIFQVFIVCKVTQKQISLI